jgi:acyl-CoA synthetase (AMP-forming)/AMP-acid ligase II
VSAGVPDLPLLADYLDWYARTTPNASAVAAEDEHLSYSELRARVRSCAGALLACGVTRGDRVCMLSTPGGAFLVTFLASASIGAIWVGLNPRHTASELDAVVDALEPRLIIGREAVGGRSSSAWLGKSRPGVTTVVIESGAADALPPFSGAFQAEDDGPSSMIWSVRPEDICLIVSTSGTSGRPKGVTISHRALIGCSKVQLEQWDVSPLRVLNNLPISHIGSVGDLSCFALIGGGTIVFCEKFDPAASLNLIENEAVTVVGQVPTQLELTLAAPGFDQRRLGGVQRIVWGGAQASESLVERLLKLGRPIGTSYGQNETVGSITFTAPDATFPQLSKTVGHSVEPYRIRIDESEGGDGSATGIGEVQVFSPYLMSGCWRDEVATARAFTTDGWLRTGDIGAIDEDVDLHLQGRLTDVFKSGGYNIFPAEIEAAVASHPDVADVAVVSIPSDLYGAVGVAAVVLRADAALTASALSAYLSGRLANYKIPKQFQFVEELPKLAIGKFDKSAIRACFFAAHVPDAPS